VDAARVARSGTATIPRMTFEDLPADWPQRPLTDPVLVDDVLDLVVDEPARRRGCLAVLACDDDVRLLQPLVIDELPSSCDPSLVQSLVDVVIEAFPDIAAGALVLALGRRDGLSITDDDRAWVAAARTALAGTSWSLCSAHVLTLHGSRAVTA
jgi:hypothetical protein